MRKKGNDSQTGIKIYNIPCEIFIEKWNKISEDNPFIKKNKMEKMDTIELKYASPFKINLKPQKFPDNIKKIYYFKLNDYVEQTERILI